MRRLDFHHIALRMLRTECERSRSGKYCARGTGYRHRCGHGGPKFPGAHYRGIYEKDLNLKVALKLGALIERELPEVKVVYTRKTDKQFSESLTKDLQARADIANKAEGDLFFSIHTNAAPTATARGVETLIMGESPLEQRINDEVLFANNKEEFIDMSDQRTAAIVRAYISNLRFTYGEYSEAMARLLEKNYKQAGRYVRKTKPQLLKVLYATNMPGVLTEIGFMSNPEELRYMCSEKGQNEIARSLFNAVKDYVNFVRGMQLVEECDDATTRPRSNRRPLCPNPLRSLRRPLLRRSRRAAIRFRFLPAPSV